MGPAAVWWRRVGPLGHRLRVGLSTMLLPVLHGDDWTEGIGHEQSMRIPLRPYTSSSNRSSGNLRCLPGAPQRARGRTLPVCVRAWVRCGDPGSGRAVGEGGDGTLLLMSPQPWRDWAIWPSCSVTPSSSSQPCFIFSGFQYPCLVPGYYYSHLGHLSPFPPRSGRLHWNFCLHT